jgi:hypothetical protein
VSTTKTIEFLRRDKCHLLRLCQEADWYNVEKCCSLLTEAFRSTSYEEVAYISNQQLLATDQWGNTPLHVACFHKPPLSVIKKILKAASEVPGQPLQLHTIVNDKGATPLLICCKAGACRQLIYALLHPPKGLLSGCAAVTKYDCQGLDPFLGLINRYEMIKRIPTLNKEDYTPLEQVTVLQENTPELCDELSLVSTSNKEWTFSSWSFPVFWKCIEDLIQSAWTDDSINDFPPHLREHFISPLHGAAYIAECMPHKLTDLILRVHSDQLRQSAVLPLHLAIAARRCKTKQHWRFVNQRAYFIERLLELDPSAATALVPGTARPTFCQAVASGLSWHLPGRTTTTTTGPIQTLFGYCPDALLEKDTKTGLYPFMLAACVPQPAIDEEDEEHISEIFQLDTIYNLLRLCPESIRG